MRNLLLWIGVITIFIGMFYYINQEQSTTDSYDEEQSTTDSYDEISEEDAASHRNYNEPRVQVSAYKLYSSYDSNSIRAKALYDGKLIEITNSPLKVDSAPGGGAIIYLANHHTPDVGIYAKGGKAFKSEAAKLDSTFSSITLLCYTDEFSIKNPILTDCIFDLKTMSEREARSIARWEANKESWEKARENDAERLKAINEKWAKVREDEEKAREEEVEGRKAAEEKDRKIRAKAERERIKADEARTQSASESQDNVETEPYNTTYVDGNGLADSDYFD